MIDPGKYTVIATLDISRPLLQQIDDTTVLPNNIHKVLLQGKSNIVTYFLELDFGINSILQISKKINHQIQL